MPNQPSQVNRDLNLNSDSPVELSLVADIFRGVEAAIVEPGFMEVNRGEIPVTIDRDMTEFTIDRMGAPVNAPPTPGQLGHLMSPAEKKRVRNEQKAQTRWEKQASVEALAAILPPTDGAEGDHQEKSKDHETTKAGAKARAVAKHGYPG